jgi:hypothetical protein
MLQVEICVKGCINEDWSEWYEGLTIRHAEGEQTILSGPVVDQPALYGLIARLSRLGLPLISVEVTEQSTDSLEPDQSDAKNPSQAQNRHA